MDSRIDIEHWVHPPFSVGHWHALCERLDALESDREETVAAFLAKLDDWPDQLEAAEREWGHNELGEHGLRELLLWHWLAVPSRHVFLRLVSAIRLFGPRAAQTFASEVDAVSEHLSLEAFSVRHCGLGSDDVRRLLSQVTDEETLRYLELRDNDVQAAAVGFLSRYAALRHLDLRSNAAVWDEGAGELPASIRTLLADRTRMTDDLLADIVAGLPELEALGLSGNPLTDSAFVELAGLDRPPPLRRLYLGDSELSGVTLESLVDAGIAEGLEELVLVGGDLSELDEAVLPQFGALRHAALVSCQIPPEVVDSWLRSPAGERLEWVDISDHGTPDASA